MISFLDLHWCVAVYIVSYDTYVTCKKTERVIMIILPSVFLIFKYLMEHYYALRNNQQCNALKAFCSL